MQAFSFNKVNADVGRSRCRKGIQRSRVCAYARTAFLPLILVESFVLVTQRRAQSGSPTQLPVEHNALFFVTVQTITEPL